MRRPAEDQIGGQIEGGARGGLKQGDARDSEDPGSAQTPSRDHVQFNKTIRAPFRCFDIGVNLTRERQSLTPRPGFQREEQPGKAGLRRRFPGGPEEVLRGGGLPPKHSKSLFRTE